MSQHARLGRSIAGLFAVLALALPATASAAAPVVETGAATDITQTTASLTGTVDPNGNPSVYFFRYGTNTLYGAQTPDADAGAGTAARKLSVPVGGLQPFTTYHYQLVARYGNQIVKGSDRTFKTQRQPLGLTLAAMPNTVPAGGTTTLAGNLAGTGNAGRQVVLQYNPFPYTQGFLQAGNAQVVDAAGNFAFPVLGVAVNSRYRALVPDKPEIVSPEVAVGVKVRVTTRKRPTGRVRRGRRARFSGTITPSNDDATVAIQRRFHGVWVTVARTSARPRDDTSSSYSRRVRVRSSGTYRVLVTPGPAYVANNGRAIRVRVKRR